MKLEIEGNVDTFRPEITGLNDGRILITAYSDEFGELEMIFSEKEVEEIRTQRELYGPHKTKEDD